jgi:hypothetical protein
MGGEKKKKLLSLPIRNSQSCVKLLFLEETRREGEMERWREEKRYEKKRVKNNLSMS